MSSVKRMLLVTVVTMLGSDARAEVRIAEDVWNGTARFSGVDYGISEDLGRAWLVVHFKDGPSCPEVDGPCEFDTPLRVHVPGLKYDRSTRRVLLDDGHSEPVVCAQVERHSFITSWETIEPTGKCGYHLAQVDRFVDDGYSGHRDSRKEIFFGVAPGSREHASAQSATREK